MTRSSGGSSEFIFSPSAQVRTGGYCEHFAWVNAGRSEGSETPFPSNVRSHGVFLDELMRAWIAPGERFSFRATKPTLAPAAINSCSWANSARVQGRPAGR